GAGLDALSGAVRTLHEGQEEARGEIEAHGRALREVREELRRDVSASRDALLRASQGLDARMAEGFGALSGALRDVHEEQAGARRNAEAHGQEIRAALGEAREEQRGGFLALQERLGAWGGELRGEVAGSRDALLRASAGLDARVGALAEAVAQARAQREQAEGASRERDEALAADIGRASGALRARLDDVASRLDEGAKARHEAVLDGLRAEAGLLRDEAKLRAEEHAHELARLQERVSSLGPALLGRLDAAQEAQAGRDAEIGSRLDEFARRLAEARSSLEGAVRSSV